MNNYWVFDAKYIAKCQVLYEEAIKAGTGTRRRMAEDPIDYAGITVEDCDAAFTTVFALYDCLNEIKSLKYDVVTCNTITWLEFTSNNLQLEPPVPDFMPPPSAYFECYFKKTQMKNETKFKSEHKKACDNLYSNN